MNWVFGILIVSGIILAAVNGTSEDITGTIVKAASSGVLRTFNLVGILTLWLGIAKIAEKSGLLALITRFLQPLVRPFFPDIPRNHPAMSAILMNFSANLFGFGSAATPFGLKAMQELQTLNPDKQKASTSMCTFLAINTSSITIIPTTIIAVRANIGSTAPGEVLGSILFATTISTLTAIIADFLFRKHSIQHR